MRTLVLLAALAAGAGGLVAPHAPKPAPTLHVVRDAPLTLRGSGFLPRERVTVTVRMGTMALSRRTRAGAAGGFTVRWPSERLQACVLPLVIQAVGNVTGVVHADVGHRDCAPQ